MGTKDVVLAKVVGEVRLILGVNKYRIRYCLFHSWVYKKFLFLYQGCMNKVIKFLFLKIELLFSKMEENLYCTFVKWSLYFKPLETFTS